MEDNMEEFEVEVDEELYAQIEAMAKAYGITVEEYVAEAVKRFVESLPKEEDNAG